MIPVPVVRVVQVPMRQRFRGLTHREAVLLRGPSLFEGYDDGHGALDHAATEQVMRDGWLHTADLGRLDSDGRL